MILRRDSFLIYLSILLLNLVIFDKVKGQQLTEFERYSKKYPNNSIILTSLKQELVIKMTNGKPVLNLSEYNEYLALNDDAIYFAESKEKFGALYGFKNIEAYTLVPEKGGYNKIMVKNFNKTSEISNTLFYDDVIDYNFTFPSVVRGVKMISKLNTSSNDPSFAHRFYFGGYFPGEEYIFSVTCPENVEINLQINNGIKK